MTSENPAAHRRALLEVGAATFGILVLELALIRWMSGQVRLLAYFNNLILIGCFLGMGAGVLLGPRRPWLAHLTLPLLALLSLPLAFSTELGIVQMTFPDPSVHLWGAERGGMQAYGVARALLVVLGLFAGVVAVFACAGSAVGGALARLRGLAGYSADLIGSLLGVLVMAAITAAGTPPAAWLAIAVAPFVWLAPRAAPLLSGVVVLALAFWSAGDAVYSPYNRIELSDQDGTLTLSVNRDFHQYMHDFRNVAAIERQQLKAMYDVPYTLDDSRERALVIGAGTGNDVRAALRNGYAQVYSVDIDPRIIAIGRAMHPEKPYSDPRAVPIVDDGRAFLERYDGPAFDVVSFGFVDSHAMFSALSTLRLDNYLYTEQALRSAWRHTKPDGYLTVNLSFIGGEWMLKRLNATLEKATGRTPMVVNHNLHRAVMLVVPGPDAKPNWGNVPFPLGTVPGDRAEVRTTSDDWPFLYLRPATVPWGYLIVLGVVMLSAFALVAGIQGPRALRREFDWTLFLMGAAFLLLETRGVTSLSLLFGSTWIVNTVVFGGVLVMALAANVYVQRRPRGSMTIAFIALFAAVAVLWLVDVSTLNRLPLLARAVAGALLVGLPVGFAGVVVSRLLARSADLGNSLAANLLGAVLGGCLEYLSMYVGLRALALMALGLYLGAMLVEGRRARAIA